MNTPSCSKVWDLIKRISDPELRKELEDAFADFETAWEWHSEEYHDEPLN
jgi:hypothetical protein